jgi:hypothetical protein
MSEWITVSEANGRFGVSRNVLRRRIYAGEIETRWETSAYPPRYLVRADQVAGLRGAWRLWTEVDEETLIDFLGKIPFAALCKRLDRSEISVKRHMKELGLNQRTGASHYTATQAGLALGVSSEGVLDWIRRGEIAPMKHRPVWGRNRCFLIAHEEIERFIRARVTAPPHQGRGKRWWTWRKIPPGYFRNFAERIAIRHAQRREAA